MIKSVTIVILDEATASVDADEEIRLCDFICL